jgi:hypothetical protein
MLNYMKLLRIPEFFQRARSFHCLKKLVSFRSKRLRRRSAAVDSAQCNLALTRVFFDEIINENQF